MSPVGAVLARDKVTAILQVNYLNLIAGKHRSHRDVFQRFLGINPPINQQPRRFIEQLSALPHRPTLR